MLAGSYGPICCQATSGSVAATFDKKVVGSGLGCLQLCQLSSFKIQLVLLAQHVQSAQNWTPPYLRHWLGLRRLVNITMVISFPKSLAMLKSCLDMSLYFHVISQNSLCYKQQSWRLCSWGLRASCSRLPCGPCVETAPKHCTHQHIPCILLAFSCAMPPPLPRHVTKESLRRIARALPPQEHKVEMLDTLFGFAIHSIRGGFTFLLRLMQYFAIHSHCCCGRSSHCYEYHCYCRNSGQRTIFPKKPFRFQHSSLPSKAAAYLLLWLEAQGGRMNASVPS